jgi:hypothetical protein
MFAEVAKGGTTYGSAVLSRLQPAGIGTRAGGFVQAPAFSSKAVTGSFPRAGSPSELPDTAGHGPVRMFARPTGQELTKSTSPSPRRIRGVRVFVAHETATFQRERGAL